MQKKTIFLCLFLVTTVNAQSNQSSGGDENTTTSGLLDAVTVTARGLSEKRLDVPFTVNVIDSKSVSERNIVSVKEALGSVSGVQIHDSGAVAYSALRVRGSGSLAPTGLNDNTVGIHVDGVAQGMVGLSQNLYDIEQIEIAKGPQGTLFGRNSSSGAINVKTNNPEPFFDNHIRLGIGSNNSRNVEAMINTPLSETLSLRVAGKTSTEDNYIHDRKYRQPINKKHHNGIRAKLLWEPNTKATLLLNAYYDERKGYLPLALIQPYDNRAPLYDTGVLNHSGKRSTKGISGEFSYQWDKLKFQSITSFSQHDSYFSRAAQPLDFLPSFYALYNVPQPFYPILNAYYTNPRNNLFSETDDISQLSQEFRLSSTPEQPIQWVAGMYLSKNKRQFTYQSKRGFLPLSPTLILGADALNADIVRRTDTDTQALFGEATVPVSEQLKFIGGLRLTHESIRYQSDWTPNPDPANPLATLGKRSYRQKLSDTYLTGRAGLDYAITPNWHAYGLYSRGHKSAGFADYGNTNIVGNGKETPYQSGSVDAFELGLKGESPDGTWGVAIAAFQNNTKNDKISVPSKTNLYIKDMRNVDTRSRGIETDLYWQVSDNWKVLSSMSYIDSKVTAVPATAQGETAVGNRVPQVPKFSATLGFKYQKEIDFDWFENAHVFASANIQYVGSRAAEANNKLTLSPYHVLDASIGIGGENGKVTLWGKNLTNEQWLTYGGLLGNEMFALPAAGRTLGINFDYSF